MLACINIIVAVFMISVATLAMKDHDPYTTAGAIVVALLLIFQSFPK